MDDCHVEPLEKRITLEEQADLTDVRMLIWGMGCPNCAMRIRNSLLGLEGVVEAVIDHSAGVGRIFFNPSMVTPEQLEQAVVRAGGDGRHEYMARLVSVPS